MTTRIDGPHPSAALRLPLGQNGVIPSETIDHYIARGRRLRAQAMHDAVRDLFAWLRPGPARDRAAAPTQAERFVDGALANDALATGLGQASKEA